MISRLYDKYHYLMSWLSYVVGTQYRRGDSTKYPQHKVLWRTVENYLLIIIDYQRYLFLCSEPS